MADEVTNLSEVKSISDGTVKLSIERYNELLSAAARKPPVRNEVIKTAEMVAQDLRIWGGTFMGLGATLFTIGAVLFRKGSI